MQHKGRPRSLILGTCPECQSSNLTKRGHWLKGSCAGEQRYKCHHCSTLIPHSKLGPIQTLVFRVDNDNVTWSAYIPDNPKVPVMTDINQYGDKWGWNCYDIGLFSSRTDLAKHYLTIKDNIQEYVI